MNNHQTGFVKNDLFRRSTYDTMNNILYYEHEQYESWSHSKQHDKRSFTSWTIKLFSSWFIVWCNSISNSTHFNDVIIGAKASQITSLAIVYSAVYSGADQRKHQSSASLAFVRGIHRGPVNSPHKWQVTRKMFPFGDVIMQHNSCGLITPTGRSCPGRYQMEFIMWISPDPWYRVIYCHVIA